MPGEGSASCELMTDDERLGQFRKQGSEDVGRVKGAWIMAEGSAGSSGAETT